MARPKNDTTALSRRLEIRLSLDDEEAIKERSLQAGCSSVSDYLRRMALDGQITIAMSRADVDLTRELNRIGVNLNQGIKKLNETGRRSDDLMESLTRLNTILDQLEAPP
ncbi:MAG: plasmid mobilization relaxosome protein MobC [Gallionellaceae bacterium]|jgi:SMC interacting uncharacterized protein involved in chromosome segregation